MIDSLKSNASNLESKDHVIMIVPSLAIGGAERIVSLVSKKLMEYYQITVLTYRNTKELEVGGQLIQLNLENTNTFNKIINVFRRSYYIRKIINEKKPKKVISFVGNISPILSFKKIIPSIHNNPSFYPFSERFFLNTIYKLPNVEKIVTVSNGISQNLSKSFHLKNVQVIYNPIDDEDIDLKMTGLSPLDSEYIIGVGRLHKQKRFDLLIRAFSQSKMKDNFKLVILGEGPLRDELQELINELGLETKVLLLGLQKNPYIFMKNAKYLVLTSDHEGFGNVLIETLYCGTPVISVDCNYGPSEIIIDQYNGILLRDNKVDTIAESMNELIDNSNLYKTLCHNARNSVQKFKLSNIISEWIRLIEN